MWGGIEGWAEVVSLNMEMGGGEKILVVLNKGQALVEMTESSQSPQKPLVSVLQLPSQTSEEDHASPLNLKGDLVPQYPLQLPGEESGFLPV